jgi:hypothetical protein
MWAAAITTSNTTRKVIASSPMSLALTVPATTGCWCVICECVHSRRASDKTAPLRRNLISVVRSSPALKVSRSYLLPFLDLRFWQWSDNGDHTKFWRMVSSGMLRRVALVRTDVSEEPSASFIRVTRITELGTTLAATSNRRTLRRNTKRYFSLSPLSLFNRTICHIAATPQRWREGRLVPIYQTA